MTDSETAERRDELMELVAQLSQEGLSAVARQQALNAVQTAVTSRAVLGVLSGQADTIPDPTRLARALGVADAPGEEPT